jgi:two-component system OmpR family sensor kinase
VSPRARRPLRTRLALGLTALVAIALTVIGAATGHFLRTFLLERLDEQLVQAATQAVSRPFGRLDGLAVGTLLLETDRTGRVTEPPVVVVPADEARGRATLSAADVRALAAVRRPPEDVDLSTLGGYRVLGATNPDGDRVVVGLPLEPVAQTVRRLWLVEVLTFLPALLALAVLGAMLIRRELRPLERVSAAARRVSALPLSSGRVALDERVAVEDEGTEVGELAGAVNGMLGHVATSLEARAATEERLRRFVADASHELRRPLAAIRGYAELFRRAGDTHPDDLARAMARVEDEARRMGVLVDDLLLLARLDQGRPLRREPVDLALLAADAAADSQAAAPNQTVLLDIPPHPAFVTGDADRLRQVLANLLANARVHTPPGTTVQVCVEEADHEVVVSVTDDGPGLPAGLRERAFERFTRADDSRARDRGGSGLGLSIVAAVISAHDGRVSLDSRPGRTRVDVRLPAADAAQPSRAAYDDSRETASSSTSARLQNANRTNGRPASTSS